MSDRVVLGIDLGGTKILTAVADRRGDLLGRDQRPTPASEGPAAVWAAITASAAQALTQCGLSAAQLAAVGIGAPGPIDKQAGAIHTLPNLAGWQGLRITPHIEKHFGCPAFLINDANAAALAEHRFGAGQGCADMLYLTVSTGIGGGIIINDRLYSGTLGAAGEIGHMTIEPQGPPCACGNRGCWETLASGTALAREARRMVERGEAPLIGDLAHGVVSRISARTVQAAAAQGDAPALALIDRAACYLGIGLANLLNIFNPERIVIGGGLTRLGPDYLAAAYAVARQRAYRIAYDAARFQAPALGADAGVVGAAVYAFDMLGEK